MAANVFPALAMSNGSQFPKKNRPRASSFYLLRPPCRLRGLGVRHFMLGGLWDTGPAKR